MDGSLMTAYLEISNGRAMVRSPLMADAMSIGREPGNTIVINDPDISRRHCVIERQGGVFHLVDLDSRNGVKVNGRKVQRAELKSGDVIALGQTMARFWQSASKRSHPRLAALRTGLAWAVALAVVGSAMFIVAWASDMLGSDFPPEQIRARLQIPEQTIGQNAPVATAPPSTSANVAATGEPDHIESLADENDEQAEARGEPAAEAIRVEPSESRLRYTWIDANGSLAEIDGLLGSHVATRLVGRPARDAANRLMWELPPDGEIVAVLEADSHLAAEVLEAIERETLLMEAELAGVLRRDRNGSRLVIRVGVVLVQRAWGASDTQLQSATRELLNQRIVIHEQFAASVAEELDPEFGAEVP